MPTELVGPLGPVLCLGGGGLSERGKRLDLDLSPAASAGSELIPGQLTEKIQEAVLCVSFSQSAFHLGMDLVWAGIDP